MLTEGQRSIPCKRCGSRTTPNPTLDSHCRPCWEATHPLLVKHDAQRRMDEFQRELNEMAEGEAMGKGEIPSRPKGDGLRKTHRPGTMKWDGTQWVLAKNKPSLS